MKLDDLAVVVIGRNEGDRLGRCLRSVMRDAALVVYVDSASTDGSPATAHVWGAEVVALDPAWPTTAARARNAGFARVRVLRPDLPYVQFVDGDCEVQPGWLQQARDFLVDHPPAAAVCGRRRERHPERSVYNRLCDLEWNTPVGLVKACGGDAMMRVDALHAVDGYRSDLIAGEEPELCVRLRARGGQVHRLDAEMTLHDAALLRFEQWWRRVQRSGYAYAEGAALHGAAPEHHWVRESRRAMVWGVLLPLATLLALAAVGAAGLLLLLAYPLQWLRLFLRAEGTPKQRWTSSGLLVLGKFPEALGALRFHGRRLLGRRVALIEYK